MNEPHEAEVVIFRKFKKMAPDFHRHMLPGKVMGQRVQAGDRVLVMVCYVAALVASSALGVIVAVMAGSSAEVHLYAALAVLTAGALSNPTVAYEPLRYLNMAWPFWQLSNALIGPGSNSQPGLALVSAGALFYLAMTVSVRMFRIRD